MFSPNVLGFLNPQSLCPEAVSAELIDTQRWSSEWGRRWGLECGKVHVDEEAEGRAGT